MHFRPPGRNGSSRQSCVLLLLLFSTRDRAPSADRRKTLPRDRKYIVFYNLSSEILEASRKQMWGLKRAKFGDISDNFRLRSQMSLERIKFLKSERYM